VRQNLPHEWAKRDIGTLGGYINGRGFGKSEWKKQGLPIIRIQNLNDQSAPFNYSDKTHEERYRVNNGDLLVAWAASLGVFVWNRAPAWLNQHIFRVEVEEQLVTKPYLFYALENALVS
jgi:type I restriction enzyme S subunit